LDKRWLLIVAVSPGRVDHSPMAASVRASYFARGSDTSEASAATPHRGRRRGWSV